MYLHTMLLSVYNVLTTKFTSLAMSKFNHSDYDDLSQEIVGLTAKTQTVKIKKYLITLNPTKQRKQLSERHA